MTLKRWHQVAMCVCVYVNFLIKSFTWIIMVYGGPRGRALSLIYWPCLRQRLKKNFRFLVHHSSKAHGQMWNRQTVPLMAVHTLLISHLSSAAGLEGSDVQLSWSMSPILKHRQHFIENRLNNNSFYNRPLHAPGPLVRPLTPHFIGPLEGSVTPVAYWRSEGRHWAWGWRMEGRSQL